MSMQSRYQLYIANILLSKSKIAVVVHINCVQAVAQDCGISAMPTFQVWKGNQKVDELVGASKDKLQALIEKHV